MCPDIMLMRLDRHEEALLFQILHDLFARFVAVHTRVLAAGPADRTVIIHDADLLQVMTQTHFKIVRVMGRRDLHRAGPELLIDIAVRDHGDSASHQRQDQHLAYTV